MAETPVMTSVEPDQLQSFAEFVARLRTDNTRMAADEAVRLGPYLDALAAELAGDQEAAADKDPEITDLSKPGALSALFNQVARSTKNTILSDIVIAPETLLTVPGALEGTTRFAAVTKYNGRSFTFGFIQTFEDDKNGSTSIPLLAFDPAMMAEVAPFGSAAMLTALQTVATSSNHDMQHHYTSTILNPSIAKTATDEKLPTPEFTVRNWSSRYFGGAYRDSDPKSYESWLMLNHARVRRLMEKGPEGDALKAACDQCLDELQRMGKEMAAAGPLDKAHEAVDYFGTMMIFSMSRSMPFDHPLMEYVINKLHQVDPDPNAVEKRKDGITWSIKNPPQDPKFVAETLSNYKAQGMDLLPEEPDYASLKKLQLITITPWIVHLLSPGQPGTVLGDVQERVGQANRDMLRSSALTAWFSAVDGLHTATRPDGAIVETYFKDGLLHRDDGPAFVQKDAEGKILGEQWFQNGKRFREDGKPSLVQTDNANKRTEEWYDKEGRLSHSCVTKSDGSYNERWYNASGKKHREDGPALIEVAANGTREEQWYKNGVRHREDGPAYLKTTADGSHVEMWYKNGEIHRDDGPAVIEIAADGTREERWWKNGQHVDPPAQKTGAKAAMSEKSQTATTPAPAAFI